jgi:hypothetical protein
MTDVLRVGCVALQAVVQRRPNVQCSVATQCSGCTMFTLVAQRVEWHLGLTTSSPTGPRLRAPIQW